MTIPKEIVRDVTKLKLLKEVGVASCHFILLDEDGIRRKTLHNRLGNGLIWRKLTRPGGKTSYLLHMEL